MTKEIEENGEKIVVYTADEVAARETAAKESVTTEFTTKLTEAETEKKRLEGLLNDRAGEFKQFRQLNEDQKAALSVAEREKYEIAEQLNKANESITALQTGIQQGKIDAVIAAQCGNDAALIEKTKAMYGKIDLPATTPDEIAARVRAAFGAIAPTEPSVASFLANNAGNGSYQPPQAAAGADTPSDRTKQGASELGLKI